MKETKMRLLIDNVSKLYKQRVWGIRDFSLELGPGVIGLLGPNGAGKSTLLRIIATITKPSGGKVTWNGTDVMRTPNVLRSVLGYLPQDFGIYPNLNAVEFLAYLAAMHGLEPKVTWYRIDKLLQVVNLTEVRKRPLGSYSGGMKQRIGIAQALLNDPQLLIIDEPTVGLDPEERVRFRNLLSDLSGERIIILSTHIVSDVEATATDMVIIAGGRLLTHAAPEALLSTVYGKVWEWVIPSQEFSSVKQQFLITGTIRRKDGVYTRIVSDNPPDPSAHAVSPTLEDAYLHIIANTNNGRSAQ
jgi:ABC-type multidrug transport system ATPase subunit